MLGMDLLYLLSPRTMVPEWLFLNLASGSAWEFSTVGLLTGHKPWQRRRTSRMQPSYTASGALLDRA
ncbi:hypothetical protein BDV27DRAFT_127641 [Aspergillus caelatus]|uniref:Uncharacterized protein n=1 Tax=Aspergillus caelatus TaxID=61420 RepID=A0A5N7A6A4_9EURO|nr:uncharacterized protein BDV27DRAFT_127641 [Aspergillus caelatus]KAE8364968.1 hypothetical protein BDV27DRAFT_127641 [Aspergillus caelatus]